mmetsp:Transcript_17256/g.35963  ORF Transcript_17256/g.35963 Transcript_17256/m.35963 type:complete len:333 (-) Transcript_17256:392-1390(-)
MYYSSLPSPSPSLSPPTFESLPQFPSSPAPPEGDSCCSTTSRRVDHTYRDFANFRIDLIGPSDPEFAALGNRKKSNNFPAKLHSILSNPKHAHIVRWMPHGRAWKIFNKDLLVSEVIPNYWGQTKYESFSRQLSGWGFKRLHQTGPDFRAYYHECFLRGLPDLTKLMNRVESTHKGKLLPHPNGEPNFYKLSVRHPLPDAADHPPAVDPHYPLMPPPMIPLPHSQPPLEDPVPFTRPPPPYHYGYNHYDQIPHHGYGHHAYQYPNLSQYNEYPRHPHDFTAVDSQAHGRNTNFYPHPPPPPNHSYYYSPGPEHAPNNHYQVPCAITSTSSPK